MVRPAALEGFSAACGATLLGDSKLFTAFKSSPLRMVRQSVITTS